MTIPTHNGPAAREKGNRLFQAYFSLAAAWKYKVLSYSFMDWKMLCNRDFPRQQRKRESIRFENISKTAH
jgi:hypothetical protein